MAPKTIQRVIEDRFAQLAEQAGLEFITSGDYWLIMDDSDGLDTRLHIKHTFDTRHALFELSGQALNAPDLDFFRDRKLYPQGAGSHVGRVLSIRAEYDSSDQLRRIFDLVRDLIAPFATGGPAGTLHRVGDQLRARGVPGEVVTEVLTAAVLHGRATLPVSAGEFAVVRYDQPSNLYMMATAPRESFDDGPGLLDAEDEDEDEDIALLLWVRGQAISRGTLTAEVRFAGEARLDALSTAAPQEAAMVTLLVALQQGVIEEARVTDAAGTVIYDSAPDEPGALAKPVDDEPQFAPGQPVEFRDRSRGSQWEAGEFIEYFTDTQHRPMVMVKPVPDGGRIRTYNDPEHVRIPQAG